MMFLSKRVQYDEICMSSYQVILAYLCSNMTMKIGPKILKMPKNPVSLFFLQVEPGSCQRACWMWIRVHISLFFQNSQQISISE